MNDQAIRETMKSIDLRQFRAITFDCYGTLIDWEAGLAALLIRWAELSGVQAGSEELLSEFARAEAKVQTDLPTLLYPFVWRKVLRSLSSHFAVQQQPSLEDELAGSVGLWPVFPDTPAALTSLKTHYRLAVNSNVDIASFGASHQRLGTTLDLVVTAEEAGSYKPARQNFLITLRKLQTMFGVRPHEVLHIAQSLYHDHVPAKHLGLSTVLIDRRRGKSGSGATVAPTQPVEPDLVLGSLQELAVLADMAFAVGKSSI